MLTLSEFSNIKEVFRLKPVLVMLPSDVSENPDQEA